MAPHSSTLAWKIPWMEEPGRLQSMGSLRVGHDWATSFSLFTFMHWRRKWQPTAVFLPGKSHGQKSLAGYSPCGDTKSDTTKWLNNNKAMFIFIITICSYYKKDSKLLIFKSFFFTNFFKILFYFLTLQYCIGFAIYQNESATGIHVFPILKASSLLPPHTIPLGHPIAPAPSIQYCALNLDWRLVSYVILYIFQCHSPKSSHPLPLQQSP